MRIGLVVEQFDLLRGGLEQWSAQFAARLVRRGHEVHAVSTRFCDRALALPIIPHYLGAVRTRTGFAEAAEALLRTLDLDLVHDTGAGWHCDVFQPHGGSRAAASEHNLLMLPPWLRPVKRAVNRWLPRYRGFDRLTRRQYVDDGRVLLALSRELAADFRELHGAPAGQIRLVYNGVDTERFSPEHRAAHRRDIRRSLGIDDGTLLLLIVAHNFRLKGVPVLLRAMARLAAQRRPVHLLVVGGKHLGAYRRAARLCGAGEHVTFAGTVRDTVPYYAAADVYVHPTFHDSCSLVVLEALASGLPVITSGYNGAGELLSEGVEGFVLSDPADLDALLARVETFFDPAAVARMGCAARRLALAHSLDRNVDEILAVYEEVLRTRGESAGKTAEPAPVLYYGRDSDAALEKELCPTDSPPSSLARTRS